LCTHTKPLLPKSSPYYKGETHLLYAALYAAQQGFEDPAFGEKRSATLVRKETKKEEKKHIFTCVPTNEAMAVAGLARLEGQCMVERWGFEDPVCGVKSVSVRLVRKGMKKKEKKKT